MFLLGGFKISPFVFIVLVEFTLRGNIYYSIRVNGLDICLFVMAQVLLGEFDIRPSVFLLARPQRHSFLPWVRSQSLKLGLIS